MSVCGIRTLEEEITGHTCSPSSFHISPGLTPEGVSCHDWCCFAQQLTLHTGRMEASWLAHCFAYFETPKGRSDVWLPSRSTPAPDSGFASPATFGIPCQLRPEKSPGSTKYFVLHSELEVHRRRAPDRRTQDNRGMIGGGLASVLG